MQIRRLILVLVGASVVLGAAVPAASAAITTRNLLLSERFRPTQGPSASTSLASSMVALRGETEGFQLAALAQGTQLTASVNAASDPFLVANTRFLRIGYVNITKPSTGISLGTGTFADPLPPQTAAGLATTPNQWGGFVVLVDVPRNATPGTYTGSIDLQDQTAAVVANVPYSIRVSTINPLPVGSRYAFQAYVGLTTRYLAAIPYTDRDVVMANLFTFLAQHHISPTVALGANPQSNGVYDANSAANLDQLHSLDLSSFMIPMKSDGMSVIERAGSSAAAAYLSAARSAWRAKGFTNRNVVAWAWDEPGPSTETTKVPKVVAFVHKYFPEAKVMVTTQPYKKTKSRKLRANFGAHRLYTIKGNSRSNKVLWDGGSNDIDIWNVPNQRYYGTYTKTIEKMHHINHSLDAYKLLNKQRSRGKQVWSYSYYMPTRRIPQRAIDGPPADSRLLMAWNAYENNRGWLVWDVARWVGAASGSTSPRNPYTTPWSYQGKNSRGVNGEASLIYPGYAPQYGLTDGDAAPVSSLRLENLRDGIEDVDLATLYRARFGNAAVRTRYKSVFGKVTEIPKDGHTWPTYDNSGIAVRIELARRAMIAGLES